MNLDFDCIVQMLATLDTHTGLPLIDAFQPSDVNVVVHARQGDSGERKQPFAQGCLNITSDSFCVFKSIQKDQSGRKNKGQVSLVLVCGS